MPTYFRVDTYFDFANNGTMFTDAYGRVWQKRALYGQQSLIGITRDTPSFTDYQLKGIVIDGFHVLPSKNEKDDSHKRSIASRVF